MATPQFGGLGEMAAYLTDGFWQDNGLGRRSFDTSQSNVITVNITGLTTAGKKLARNAMEAWETVADIKFQETTGSAQINFDDEGSGAFTSFNMSGNVISSAAINIDNNWHGGQTWSNSYTQQTYIHELGHALGLGHQGNYNGSADYTTDATFTNDSWLRSVMSYFDQDENPTVDASKAYVISAMRVDIIAIQELYGAPGSSSATAGNTTWGVNSNLDGALGDLFDSWTDGSDPNIANLPTAFTIYDKDGKDTLDVSNFSSGSNIDMRDSKLSDVGGLSGNIAIARDTVLENLTTGIGDDTVTGNSSDNFIKTGDGKDSAKGADGEDTIWGLSGEDTLFGEDGNDTLNGGKGNDKLYGGNHSDTLVGSLGHDTMFGGTGSDNLHGGHHQDLLYGGGGNDTLTGANGDDFLKGNSGADIFVFGDGHGDDTIRDFDATSNSERIDFSGLSSLNSISEVRAAATQTGDDVLLQTGDGNSILLRDVQYSDLHNGDFLF
ncbi:M10 family metallopeptidase C-terminal domain-containing protein [Leisingera sp. M527]|uniref:M10 family metallopeptidase n=1 Tax=Leisingera sp. M527 TaxID=2867014 RepID=UPI0021A5534D|nr:M10 family metallopeptidase [Leisingera sp. M527]UWQ32725.1 M10 family metallopeptidase C-terminal domain-containing protein [Leisingera sp. M527]